MGTKVGSALAKLLPGGRLSRCGEHIFVVLRFQTLYLNPRYPGLKMEPLAVIFLIIGINGALVVFCLMCFLFNEQKSFEETDYDGSI